MRKTKVAVRAIEDAKIDFLEAMRQRRADGKTAVVIADNYAVLSAELELDSHQASHVKAALKQMHIDGFVQCGHAAFHELSDSPASNVRSYKIKMLIK